MKRNTFILKCFLQFICTNLDGSQKEGGNFLNLLQKQGIPRKGGASSGKGGGFQPWRKLWKQEFLKNRLYKSYTALC